MKINTTTTKQGLVEFMQGVLDSDKYILESKTLVDMMIYTLKAYAKKKSDVLKDELMELALEVQEYITPKQEALPLETKIKAVEKEDVEEEEEEEAKPKKKAIAKKKVAPKVAPVVTFPKELSTKVGEFTLVTEGIDNVKDVREAIESGRELVFAILWTKTLLKQFQYGADPMYKDIKEFPDNLDVSDPLYIMTNDEGLYILSIYTEMMGKIVNGEFDVIEGVRYSNGAEWGLYENLNPETKEEEQEELTQEYLDTDQVDEEEVKALEEQEEQEELEEIERETEKAKAKRLAKGESKK